MRASEVAKLFGVTTRQVLRWGGQGKLRRTLHPYGPRGPEYVYEREQVLELLKMDPKTHEYVDPEPVIRTTRKGNRWFDLEDTEEL